jgi:hypothetical protein
MLKQKIENVIAAQEIEKARNHIRANQKIYIALGVGVLVGRATAPRGRDVHIVNTVVGPSHKLHGL